ncbi:Ankyrin repeat-containing domain protein [Amanita muscaria]
MGNTSSSLGTPGTAATDGNVQTINVSNTSNSIITTAARDVTQTINYNFAEASGNIGKYKMWLDPPDPSINHNSVFHKHHPNTGNWLRDHPVYENWKTMSNSFLWLHGLSGSGKTVLCSTMIENVQTIVEQGSIGMAYYYFDIFDVKKRTVEGLLSSLSLSLYACNPSNHTIVEQLYMKCKDGVFKPSGQQLEYLLKELISGFKETYIVIDALDECREWQELWKFLKMIHGWQIGQCHLLVTSRREQVIVNSLQHVEHEEIDLTLMPIDNDINRYIDEKLEQSEELKNNNMGALKRTIEMLPKDLETTYDQILERIHAADAKHAMKLLYWLIFAIEPLKLEELAIVVEINEEKNTLDTEEKLDSPNEILKICSSLVTLSEDGTAKLAHASVKEYFLKEPRKIGTVTVDPCAGDLLLTKCCLAYLHQPRKVQGKYWGVGTLPRYCAKLWPKHILACKNEAVVKKEIMMVCETGSIAFKNWKSWRKNVFEDEDEDILPETPLEYAVESGLLETDIAKLLVDKGADVNAKCGFYGNALQAASYKDSKEIVELLLGKGADVNAQGGFYGNALQAAISKGSKEIVELLLEKGADVNAQGGEYDNALQIASCQGATDIVELLLDKGADVNAHSGFYGNALQVAICQGTREIVELLLEKGADVNAQGGFYGNALQAALSKGAKDITELLLDKGADVNAQGSGHENALFAAVSKGAKDIVELLLDKGADVNAQGGEYGSPLQAAISKGAREIIELLLDKGADVNAQGGEYGNPLHAAISKAILQGSKEIVELLVDKGADVNAEGGFHGSALFAAIMEGAKDIVELLLSKGGKVNACNYSLTSQGGFYRYALQVASHKGAKEIVELLLEKGANVNAQGGFYGNALQAASCQGSKEIVELLLEKGADVNAQGGKYGNALKAVKASSTGEDREGLIQVLIAYGAKNN